MRHVSLPSVLISFPDLGIEIQLTKTQTGVRMPERRRWLIAALSQRDNSRRYKKARPSVQLPTGRIRQ